MGSPSSSSESPTTSTPWSLYVSYSSFSTGISTRQGGHQVAQKFTTTTFPFKAERLASPPPRTGRVKSGAALPSFSMSRASIAFNSATTAARTRGTMFGVTWIPSSLYTAMAVSGPKFGLPALDSETCFMM